MFGLLWQRSKCTESPVHQLFQYFLFWTCMKLNVVLISCLTGKCATQNLKTYAILVYGHVDILWTYQRAKIEKNVILA